MKNGFKINFKKVSLALAGIVLSLISFILLEKMPMPARVTASVFILMIFYWMTETFPLHITAILGPFLVALFLDPLAPFFGIKALDFKIFMTPFVSPVIVLLFGSFIIAYVFSAYHLDSELSNKVLKKLGRNPKKILLGLMAFTAFLSMWMSNTATTAIMLATILPVAKRLTKGSNFSKALILSIPFAANIGGIATPVGTPPNAIAIGMLSGAHHKLTFFKWMIAGLPPTVLALFFAWFLLLVFFPPEQKSFELNLERLKSAKGAEKHRLIYYTILITIILWMTDAIHGIDSSIIALIPLLVFTMTGITGKKDLNQISWDVLLLVGGGLSMGVALTKTGLSEIVIETLNLKGLNLLWLGLSMGGLVAVFATFLSHSASANLMIPIAISLSAGNPAFLAVTTAVCASFGMSMPISTPPNAIAYGSEMISTKDMFKAGALITILGVILTVFYEYGLFVLLKR